MSNFTKHIYVDGRLLEFDFASIRTVTDSKYFVRVDDSTREYHFVIEKINTEWKIHDAPKIPEWIHELEVLLIQAISENEESI